MRALPITWQQVFDWCAARMTALEAYDHADALWQTLAENILDELTDLEVEALAQQLMAEHGAYEVRPGGSRRPDITDRHFPYRLLDRRLTRIETRRAWLESLQSLGPACQIADHQRMIALVVRPPVQAGDTSWRWEVVQGNTLEKMGSARSEETAWQQVREYWQTARPRLLGASARRA
jgi:hypothetical protein